MGKKFRKSKKIQPLYTVFLITVPYIFHGLLMVLTRKLMSEWRPSGCGQDRDGPEANFNWPTDLALNPVTNTLALIDQESVKY